jgi:23S rRNA pseudouridine2605 synthase
MPPTSRRPQPEASPDTSHVPGEPQRLQKVLAAAGIGSRRHCEELITAGRVEVDRHVVTELGTKVDPAHQEIRVDGVPLTRERLVYFLVHKPRGVVSTNSDPSGRMRVVDLVSYPGRLFTVGRLDMSSEGLILVTNDGQLANHLTHPRYGVEKTYHAEVAGVIEREHLDRLRKGVHLAEGVARVVSAKVKHQYKNSTLLEIVLAEGRNREIRRILARVGHKVERLKRVAIGPLRLGEMVAGEVRPLDRSELRKLKQAAYGAKPEGKPRRPRPLIKKVPRTASPARVIIGGDRSASAGVGPGRPKIKASVTSRRSGKSQRRSGPRPETR